MPVATTSFLQTAGAAAPARSDPDAAAPMVAAEGLGFRYGPRTALEAVSLSVGRGEVFGLLGPNGSGKTTLFRILSTAFRPAAGRARIDGHDLVDAPEAVRHRLGVAFQSPSLDGKLSVEENLRFHAYLFGLHGRPLRQRLEAMLERFALAERRRDRVETLSGGLKRRVELAKALLPGPPLLLLDEPSTGLDPAARRDFWEVLEGLRRSEHLTVVLATHLMDEAERCDRVALLDRGRLVALDTPEALRRQVGGEVITLEAARPEALARALDERLHLPSRVVQQQVRLETADGLGVAARVLEHFGGEIRSLTLGRPTLEDVFLARTGHRLSGEAPAGTEAP